MFLACLACLLVAHLASYTCLTSYWSVLPAFPACWLAYLASYACLLSACWLAGFACLA
jgi:hypothetical protein